MGRAIPAAGSALPFATTYIEGNYAADDVKLWRRENPCA